MSADHTARRRSMIALRTGVLTAAAASAQTTPSAKPLKVVLHVI